MLRDQKAQAVLELAILGSLIITAFAILISYSEGYNREQSYMQQTFRAALKKAQKLNNSASWTTTDFRRMPNLTNPMELGQLQQFGSGSSVLWTDGKQIAGAGGALEDSVPKAYFQLNRVQPYSNEFSVNEEDAGPQEGDITISNSYHYSYLNSSAYSHKTEGGNIHTNKTLTATDTIIGGAKVGDNPVSLNSALSSGGLYKNGVLSRSTKDLK